MAVVTTRMRCIKYNIQLYTDRKVCLKRNIRIIFLIIENLKNVDDTIPTFSRHEYERIVLKRSFSKSLFY